MVWGLFPVDPLPGENTFYFCSKGTYKVGRKGCDVIINKDKGVSRVHAEITVSAMKNTSKTSSKVQLKDCSKYGTFLNNNVGSKQQVHEFPNKEISLKDGDLISFGTGNATYRFCHVPLIFLICFSEPLEASKLLKHKISLIGACIANTSLECTHVLVGELTPLTEEILDAAVAKKPIVKYSFVEAIAENSTCTEIPSCSNHMPTLEFEGAKFKVVEPKSQESCLRGYTFLLESQEKYKLKSKLHLLLKVNGGMVIPVEQFYPSSQGVKDEGNRLVHVIPAESTNNCDYIHFHKLSSVSIVNERDLISAVLSGCLDPSILVLPPIPITSSCSTDETVVADSDAEMEVSISIHDSAAVYTIKSSDNNSMEEIPAQDLESSELNGKEEMTSYNDFLGDDIKKEMMVESLGTARSNVHVGKMKIASDHDVSNIITECHTKSLEDRSDRLMAKIEKIDETETGSLDIIYSQDLIVRNTNLPARTQSMTNGGVVNFKLFKRKTRMQSGNSFNDLVPFSKYPYKDSDYGNEKNESAMMEEKMRKQMEAVAEDLFNNEKKSRRGAAGSLHALFSRNR